MSESSSTVEQYAASTNGRVHFEDPADADSPQPAATARTRGVSSFVVPLVLIATALIVLRRMQRGNYA